GCGTCGGEQCLKMAEQYRRPVQGRNRESITIRIKSIGGQEVMPHRAECLAAVLVGLRESKRALRLDCQLAVNARRNLADQQKVVSFPSQTARLKGDFDEARIKQDWGCRPDKEERQRK